MNRRREVNNSMGTSCRTISGSQQVVNCLDKRDEFEESLLLFKEMHKRGNDCHVSLLQPISDEFEANGSHALYRVASGKRGSGLETLAESGKNDYDWLKTPPATPLFPSLEMETNAPPELVMQKELPIIQPLSRFAGNNGTPKVITNRPPSSNPKPKLHTRHITTPIKKQNSPLNDKKNMKTAPILSPKSNSSKSDNSKKESSSASSMGKTKTSPREIFQAPKNRGISPKISPQITGFSNETPPNLLRAERSISAYRGQRKQEPTTMKDRRQTSCSPGRQRIVINNNTTNVAPQMGRYQTRNSNKSQVLGSKMVDKFLNARKSNGGEIQTRAGLKLDDH
ncbi:hypothetical protein Leryth_018796 [Lithospermum erythrorhizon]|nr:hypothetical protein Leryth_018796 [Lithospermum erythrorhizon]